MPDAVAFSQHGCPRIIYHLILGGKRDGLVKGIFAAPCCNVLVFFLGVDIDTHLLFASMPCNNFARGESNSFRYLDLAGL
jgi:hypothetical protein